MICPYCKKAIPELFKICPYCSNELISPRRQSLKNIRENINYLKTLKQYFETALRNIETEIQNITLDSPKTFMLPQSETEKQKISAVEVKRKTVPEKKSDFFERFFGEKLLLSVGILAVLFAAGFFLKYSFEKNLFSPHMKVALTSLFGAVFILLGIFLKEKQKTFGLILTAGGIAVLFFANFAAVSFYSLYGIKLSLLINLFLIAFSVYLANSGESQWIAIVGLGGGFLTPLFFESEIQYLPAYFSYLGVLSLGSLIVAFKKKWSIVPLCAFVFSSIWFANWSFNFYFPELSYQYLTFGLFLYLVFVLSPLAYSKLDKASKLIPAVFSISVFPVYSSYTPVPLFFNILYLFAGIIVLYVSEKLPENKSKEVKSFIRFLGIITFAAGISLGFKSVASTSFTAMLILSLSFAYMLTRKRLFANIAVLTAIFIFFKLFLFDLETNLFYNFDYFFFTDNVNLPQRIMEYFAFIVFTGLAAKVFKRAGKTSISKFFNFTAFLSSILILTFETASLFHYILPKAQNLSVSVLWALIGVLTFTYGVRQNNPSAKTGGYVIFFIVFFKVFLIDASAFSTIYKVLTFLLVGIILIVSSYLYYKTKKQSQ